MFQVLAFRQSADNRDENGLNNFFAEILKKENTKTGRRKPPKFVISYGPRIKNRLNDHFLGDMNAGIEHSLQH